MKLILESRNNIFIPRRGKHLKVTRSMGWETTLHVVAAILRTPRDPCTLPNCSSVMIGEYPVLETRLVC